MTATATFAGAAPDAAVCWHALLWRPVFRTVRRLQVRIVKAIQQGRWGKARALVHLLTHSFSGRACAVLRVTENSGNKTPGVDGEVWDDPEQKAHALHTLRRRGYQAQPLRRVYIPKGNSDKMRPLGIPTMRDRAMQALYLLGLEPIAETLGDPYSYGFRVGRSCADALGRCQRLLWRRHSADWVLEGDIKSCFDRISHDWLLTHIPMDKVILRQWLKAGYLEAEAFHPTETGTPQGGIISPALANRALDGLQAELQRHFSATGRQARQTKVHLVRYADDFVVTGSSRELLAEQVLPVVQRFLNGRGLELSRDKTKITAAVDGFDFLGQQVRRFGRKLLVRPAKAKVRALLDKVRDMIGRSGAWTAGELIQRLNPLLRGWTLYHRHAHSSRTFAYVDHVLRNCLWRWARRRHRRRTCAWIRQRYFPRQAEGTAVFRGVATDKEGRKKAVALFHPTRQRIVRHVPIRGEANPFDPVWEEYFEQRSLRGMLQTLPGQSRLRFLWQRQQGLCPICGQPLTPPRGCHIHHRQWRVYGGDDLAYNLELLHPNCHRQVHSQGVSVEQAASPVEEAFAKA
jgi:RNA-directed DNA polymerase